MRRSLIGTASFVDCCGCCECQERLGRPLVASAAPLRAIHKPILNRFNGVLVRAVRIRAVNGARSVHQPEARRVAFARSVQRPPPGYRCMHTGMRSHDWTAAMSAAKTIGVLTSGGDCAGLNAVIRAVVARA